ncbi:hypothetical protein Tco_1220054, partial [Tanacetum coccineum]
TRQTLLAWRIRCLFILIERTANRTDARDLMKLISKVDERVKHKVALIKEVDILTGSILVAQGTGNLERAQERDVEKLRRRPNEMVSEARRDAHDNTVFMTSLLRRLRPKIWCWLLVGWMVWFFWVYV